MATHISFGPKEKVNNDKLQWYEFNQNNSGGYFDIDEDVAHYVFIEAYSAKDANRIAKEIGIYFDGCQHNIDCDCCGDRWKPAYEPVEDFVVYHWNKDAQTFDHHFDYFSALADEDMFAKDGKPSVIAYYSDGSKNLFYKS